MSFVQMNSKRFGDLNLEIQRPRIHFTRAVLAETPDLKGLQVVSNSVACRDMLSHWRVEYEFWDANSLPINRQAQYRHSRHNDGGNAIKQDADNIVKSHGYRLRCQRILRGKCEYNLGITGTDYGEFVVSH
jgi:hypothetical protein